MNLSTKIFAGLILGVIAGLVAGPDNLGFIKTWIVPIGTIFINLIKMIIVPVVLASLVVGAASLGDIKKLGRIGIKTLAYYLATTAMAVTLGIIMSVLMNPGSGLKIPTAATSVKITQSPPLMDVIVNMVPTNPLKAMVNADMLPIIVFALFLGIGITLVGQRAKPMEQFFDALAEVSYKIVGIVMELAPIGVFALIVPVVAANGPKVLLPLLAVIVAVYLGCILHAGLVYSTFVATLGKMNPVRFFRGIAPAMLVAFSTCSSAAALPVNMKNTQENLGVSKEVSSFVLPLGATINMDGTALYQGVCALFIAQVYGIDLTMGQMVVIVLTGTLASIGTAGVPGAGLIMLTMVLQAVNLPLEGVALIAGIDRVLDMVRTTVNITGDAAASVIVQQTENKYIEQKTSL